MQAFHFGLLGFQFIIRLQLLHGFTAVFLLNLHQVFSEKILIINGFFQVILVVGDGMKRLIHRHFYACPFATQGLVEVLFCQGILVGVIIDRTQGQMGDVEVITFQTAFHGSIYILDGFRKVACGQIIVASHLQVKVIHHDLVTH